MNKRIQVKKKIENEEIKKKKNGTWNQNFFCVYKHEIDMMNTELNVVIDDDDDEMKK